MRKNLVIGILSVGLMSATFCCYVLDRRYSEGEVNLSIERANSNALRGRVDILEIRLKDNGADEPIQIR